ncbi:serine aminopeptidase S33 family [Hasllibacter halocynthiae]|uniref:Serine aminopeptidase S33 family n=1 Tax=Hasllibacter halocynthiae TaxID=595589 RepID=A0A2T0X6S9_9RHOB|nr:alpha/beta hydrolase [Hasllibacter halocynthiae]PRY94661.1 serine aminopeptidase S33 family [Hasllibacter halocynthiae]
MRALGRWLAGALLVLAVLAAGIWTFGPRATAEMPEAAVAVPGANEVDAWLAGREGAVPGIRPGAEKRVIWAGMPGERTEWAVVYVHGFSATSEEIRPVPDRVADALGANLFFTRLAGHGVDMGTGGDRLAETTAREWMDDTTEAAAIGAAIGERVLLVTLSTGGTLAALAAEEGLLPPEIAGIAFLSPNFRINNPLADLITAPGAPIWLPLVGGRTRSFEPLNDAHAEWWTTAYPSAAVFPLGAAVAAARAGRYEGPLPPALFLFDPEDRVIDHEATLAVAARWPGEALVTRIDVPDEGGDPENHILAGDILSPAMTDTVTEALLRFARGL